MLDECVRKLLDKKDFIVRVHPADGALVTQVLEHSREKSWSMEVNEDLEPGSLEIESMQGMVKNSSKERKEFVQGILENLVLPAEKTEGAELQSVTDALMGEMQDHPLLAAASADQEEQADQSYHADQAEQADHDMQYLGQDMENSPQENLQTENILPSSESELDSPIMDESALNNMAPAPAFPDDMANMTDENSMDNAAQANDLALQQENIADTDPMEFAQENPMQQDISDEATNGFDANNAEEAETQMNPEAEAENLVGEFLTDIGEEPELQENAQASAQNTAANMSSTADHPTGNANNSQNASESKKEDSVPLPPDLADDLLAEMGFPSADSEPN